MSFNSAAQRVLSVPVSYAPTLSSSTNATVVGCFWQRNGQFLEVSGNITWSGTGGAGAFSVALPGAVAGTPLIDTAFLPGGSATSNASGTIPYGSHGTWFKSGSGWLQVDARYLTTSTVGFFMNTQILDGSQFLINDGFTFYFKVPIVGWR